MNPEQDDTLRQQSQEIWNQNAAFWDRLIGDTGNRFHRTMVEPAALKLLALTPGETVLEVACGNGAFARRMAEAGVQVLATDFSTGLLEHARRRTQHESISYALVDATEEEQLLALGQRRFDAAVCNMGLMDMPVIDPLFAALSRVLKPGGRFVFSVQHPCFNSNGANKTVELQDQDGELATIAAIKVSRYATPWTERAMGAAGQETPHYQFHRPINQLLNAGFRAGLVLHGLEEPVDEAEPNSSKWMAWSNFQELPPVLVGRFRLG
ncbi:MAG: class I SAM-dependent methyltransferase [Chloroflexaceae bacterium]|nr:class I SAM-dependent methyltransferase [Chloroflexaceae bacterium]